jgi:transcriptional regulator with XRE-family HTH domain
MNSRTKRQLLQHPEALGCSDQFAARLGVAETQLAEWMRGEATIPDGKFLVIAAILESAERNRKSIR